MQVLKLARRKTNSSHFQTILTQTQMVVSLGKIRKLQLWLLIAKVKHTYLQEMKLMTKKICQLLPASVCLLRKPRLSYLEALLSAKCTHKG